MPRTALVLGAGGTVGIAYHAGVAKALMDSGLDPAGVDLVVGTSAGAIVGSILRSGADMDEIWRQALADQNPFMPGEPFFRPDVIFSQGWRTPLGLGRRLIGSGYVAQRTVMHWPTITPPAALQRFYRGGLGSVTEQRDEFVRWAGEDWPQGQLRLCAFDIVTGRRFVLGNSEEPRVALPDAMRASAAVPVLYPPVRCGRRLLIDGTAHSSTNLDIAVKEGAELIIVAAPMALDREDLPPAHLRVHREFFERRMACEIRKAEKAGARVLTIRPSSQETSVHGLNMLRSGGHSQVAELSYSTTREVLASSAGVDFAEAWNSMHSDFAERDLPERDLPELDLPELDLDGSTESAA
ncbi:MAG TPA: patatin-like phospholipase family protein [Microthrixaceae bacterium]|nr:patatin-like phospholipase family protein [Microthrixaceae bacterium]